ncbi:hypothetical protein KEJ39_03565 [Candidatus Bathyarchaeota archaeon]|nr:hypothetical protein [Candidatus Bathyarchaeota archaeon]
MVTRRSLEASAVGLLLLLLIIGYLTAARVAEERVDEQFHLAVGVKDGGEDTESHGDLQVEVKNFPLYVVIILATLAAGFAAHRFRRVNGGSRVG